MRTDSPSADSAARRLLGPLLTACLAALAYRPLLWPDGQSTSLSELLFLPGAVPPPLVIAAAGFVLWRRRRDLPTGAPAPLLAAGLAALGTAIYLWSTLTGSAALLLPALGLHGLALLAAARGRAACRRGLLPAAILLLGMPLPKPLEDEVLWQLQLGTTEAASRVLQAIGRNYTQLGVVLRDDTHFFHVIDGCSGLSGIFVLTLIALLVRELFWDGGRRVWLVVAVAPLLGFALNAVRVAYVAASPDPQALAGPEGDHTGQGVAVLMAGTALLYAIGWGLAGGADPDRPRVSAGPLPGSRWTVAAACGLALLSLLVPRFPEADRAPGQPALEFPKKKAGWVAKPAPANRLFHGILGGGFHRRYHLQASGNRPEQVVDLLVGFESRSAGTRMLCSKLVSPGPGWDLESRRDHALFALGRQVELAISSRDRERALSYSWRPRDRGLFGETWRALLALDSSPYRRERARAGVRLFARMPHGGPLVIEVAAGRLDRFLADFRADLDAI